MAAEDLWAPFARYKIHEESYEFVRQAASMNIKPYQELGVEGAREQSDRLASLLEGKVDFPGEEKEIIVPSPHTPSGIPVTVYKPAKLAKIPAIWVYFHGGGLVIGSRKSNINTLRYISKESGAVIVNVEYRRLPIPGDLYAPFDNGNVVTKWVMDNKEALGGKPESKVGVGGDSSGGQIVVGVTNDLPGLLDFQVLVYAMTDTSLSSPTFEEFKNVPGMTPGATKFCFENGVFHMPDYLTNPRVNGMARTNTASSPPALILLAELDPLTGCGIDYAEKLRAAGVSVDCVVIKGVSHGFFTRMSIFKKTSAEAYAHVVKFINKFQEQ